MELDVETEVVEEEGKCKKCLLCCRKTTTFLLSHVGLISLVVGYCIVGAFTFQALESAHEIQVKKNITKIREAVSEHLWQITENTELIREPEWLSNATLRLQIFERDLILAMKKGGWDGSESVKTQQWTFSGALFYSIVTVTTIGYGHITCHTDWGKVVTIFYAIFGIPLMLLCLSHIGDFMAKSFRFLYWKVCCYICTRNPRPSRRYQNRRGRSFRSSPRSERGIWQKCVYKKIDDAETQAAIPSTPKNISHFSSRGIKRSASTIRRSARTSQRSADSAYSDSAIFTLPDHGIRRVHSDDHLQTVVELPMKRMKELSPPLQYFGTNGLDGKQRIQRSTRSAEPSLGMRKNISVLCNKYAEDADVITHQTQISKPTPNQLRLARRKTPERLVHSTSIEVDYWEDDVDEYYDSDDEENVGKKAVPIWLCVLLVFGYIIAGMFLFSAWEGWKYLDSAYFCFVTLTTIGFGDYVPAKRVKNDSPEVSIALCSLYLLFGISLLAMSFNLVQEEVISNMKLMATRLGIIQEDED